MWSLFSSMKAQRWGLIVVVETPGSYSWIAGLLYLRKSKWGLGRKESSYITKDSRGQNDART